MALIEDHVLKTDVMDDSLLSIHVQHSKFGTRCRITYNKDRLVLELGTRKSPITVQSSHVHGEKLHVSLDIRDSPFIKLIRSLETLIRKAVRSETPVFDHNYLPVETKIKPGTNYEQEDLCKYFSRGTAIVHLRSVCFPKTRTVKPMFELLSFTECPKPKLVPELLSFTECPKP